MSRSIIWLGVACMLGVGCADESPTSSVSEESLVAPAAKLTVSANAAGGMAERVTRGSFQTYAAGPDRDFDISGRAMLIRAGREKTIVQVWVAGLAANTTYPAHVHNKACGDENGGGHYQNVVGGEVDAVNEIWPGITTDDNGTARGRAENDFLARPEAMAVVIHDTDGQRIACADLE